MTSLRDICDNQDDDQDDGQGRNDHVDTEMKYDPRASSSPTLSPSLSPPSSHSLPHTNRHQRGPPMASASSSHPYRSSRPRPPHHNLHQNHHYSPLHDQYEQHPDRHQPRFGGRDPRGYEHRPPPPLHGYASYSEGQSSFLVAGYPHPHHASQHYRQSHYPPHHHQEGYPQPSYQSASSRPSHGSEHIDERRASSHSRASSGTSSHMNRHVSRHQEKRPESEHQQQQIKPETVSAPVLERTASKESKSVLVEGEKYPISQARIRIAQQPLHARMCGFGEKDRRPIDPPPIVQLIVDEPNYDEPSAPPKPVTPIQPKKKKSKKKGAKKGQKLGKKALALAAAAEEAAKAEAEAAATKKENRMQGKGRDDDEDEEGHDSHDEESEDDNQESMMYELDDDEDEGDENVESEEHKGESSSARTSGRTRSSSMADIKSTTAGRPTHGSVKEGEPEDEDNTPKRRGRPAHSSVTRSTVSAGKKHSRDTAYAKGLVVAAPVIGEEESDEEQEWPRYEGGAKALIQDPLYVLHVSLWSEDGSEVRSMIATPGQSGPPKLTRILMGAVVVSPMLLNNEKGEPGWYFSFPDLSIRTEGVYTLKFSLMRFAFFDFDDVGGAHASTIVAEEFSHPFAVFSAKKFPGMTESTELSKAFAKQGLKIPIRNDLRIRKNPDKD